MDIPHIIVSVLVLVAAFLTMVTSRALWEAHDALSRLNLITPLTGVALPLLIIAHLVHDTAAHGFAIVDYVRALLAIAFLLSVASIAAFTLARTLYGTSVDDRVRAAQRAADRSRIEEERAAEAGS